MEEDRNAAAMKPLLATTISLIATSRLTASPAMADLFTDMVIWLEMVVVQVRDTAQLRVSAHRLSSRALVIELLKPLIGLKRLGW